MEKFINFMGHGILGALVLIMIGGLFIAVVYGIYLLMINYQLGIIGTLLLLFGIIGFLFGGFSYLDDNDKEDKSDFYIKNG